MEQRAKDDKQKREEAINKARQRYLDIEESIKSKSSKPVVDITVDQSLIDSFKEKELKWEEYLKKEKRREELEINPIQGSALSHVASTEDELAKVFSKDPRVKKISPFKKSAYNID